MNLKEKFQKKRERLRLRIEIRRLKRSRDYVAGEYSYWRYPSEYNPYGENFAAAMRLDVAKRLEEVLIWLDNQIEEIQAKLDQS